MGHCGRSCGGQARREARRSSKAGEVVSYAREIARALGDFAPGGGGGGGGNKANLIVANNSAAASRSRHFLRRYVTLQQRIQAGEALLVKIPDAHMPSDFLTKWIPGKKLEKSLAYATNSRACCTTSAA